MNIQEALERCSHQLQHLVNHPDESQTITYGADEEQLTIQIRAERTAEGTIIGQPSFFFWEGGKWVEIARTPWAASCFITGYLWCRELYINERGPNGGSIIGTVK